MKYVLLISIFALSLNTQAHAKKSKPKAETQAPAEQVVKAPDMATVNQLAPDFSLTGHDGKTYKLSDLKGKIVVLEWFNHECPYVKKHYDAKTQNMQKTQASLIKQAQSKKQELIWLTIVSSAPGKQGHISAEEAAKLKKDYKAHMAAFLFDADGSVGKSYAAKTTPHMYIIDQNGILKYAGGIDDKPSAHPSSLKGAKNYVTEAVTALLNNKPIAQSSTQPYGCSVKYL